MASLFYISMTHHHPSSPGHSLARTEDATMIIASVRPSAASKPHGAADSRSSVVHETQQTSQPTPPSEHHASYPSSGSRSEPLSPTLRLQQIAHQRIQYPAFRETFFFDPAVNPVLKGEGGDPDPMSTARATRKLWSSSGRSISSRLPKTAVPPGSAFRNECHSPDRLYSSSRGSLGYEVTRELAALVSSSPASVAKAVH